MNGFVCLAKPPGKTWYWPARAFPSWETAIAARAQSQPLPQPVPVPTVPKGHVVIAFLEPVEFPDVLVLPQVDVTSFSGNLGLIETTRTAQAEAASQNALERALTQALALLNRQRHGDNNDPPVTATATAATVATARGSALTPAAAGIGLVSLTPAIASEAPGSLAPVVPAPAPGTQVQQERQRQQQLHQVVMGQPLSAAEVQSPPTMLAVELEIAQRRKVLEQRLSQLQGQQQEQASLLQRLRQQQELKASVPVPLSTTMAPQPTTTAVPLLGQAQVPMRPGLPAFSASSLAASSSAALARKRSAHEIFLAAAAANKRAKADPPLDKGTFPKNLWHMLHGESVHDTISWSTNGRSFCISEPETFAAEVLPLYFRHDNFQSFARQLNYYGFEGTRNTTALPVTNSRSFWHVRGLFFHGMPMEDVKLLKRDNIVRSRKGKNVASAPSGASPAPSHAIVAKQEATSKATEAAASVLRAAASEKASNAAKVAVAALTSASRVSAAARSVPAAAAQSPSQIPVRTPTSSLDIVAAAAAAVAKHELPANFTDACAAREHGSREQRRTLEPVRGQRPALRAASAVLAHFSSKTGQLPAWAEQLRSLLDIKVNRGAQIKLLIGRVVKEARDSGTASQEHISYLEECIRPPIYRRSGSGGLARTRALLLLQAMGGGELVSSSARARHDEQVGNFFQTDEVSPPACETASGGAALSATSANEISLHSLIKTRQIVCGPRVLRATMLHAGANTLLVDLLSDGRVRLATPQSPEADSQKDIGDHVFADLGQLLDYSYRLSEQRNKYCSTRQSKESIWGHFEILRRCSRDGSTIAEPLLWYVTGTRVDPHKGIGSPVDAAARAHMINQQWYYLSPSDSDDDTEGATAMSNARARSMRVAKATRERKERERHQQRASRRAARAAWAATCAAAKFANQAKASFERAASAKRALAIALQKAEAERKSAGNAKRQSSALSADLRPIESKARAKRHCKEGKNFRSGASALIKGTGTGEKMDISICATPLASHRLSSPKGALRSDIVDTLETERLGQAHTIGKGAGGNSPSAKAKLFDVPMISQGSSQDGFGASKQIWDDAEFSDASDDGAEDDGDAGAYGLPCRRSSEPLATAAANGVTHEDELENSSRQRTRTAPSTSNKSLRHLAVVRGLETGTIDSHALVECDSYAHPVPARESRLALIAQGSGALDPFYWSPNGVQILLTEDNSPFYWAAALPHKQATSGPCVMHDVEPPGELHAPTRQAGPGRFEPVLTSQPFRVRIHPEVPFVLDLHAHLSSEEVTGFLAGRWDRKDDVLNVQAVFPCPALAAGEHSSSTNVEMDPASEMQVRKIIHQKDMQVVGWYHSRPKFRPDPSITDLQNQMRQQNMIASEIATGVASRSSSGSQPGELLEKAPFIGVIIGTYGEWSGRTGNGPSIFRYFHVRQHYNPGTNGSDEQRQKIPLPMLLTAHVRRRRCWPGPLMPLQKLRARCQVLGRKGRALSHVAAILCEVCGKKDDLTSSSGTSVKKSGGDGPLLLFTCDIGDCCKSFSSSAALRGHKRWHTSKAQTVHDMVQGPNASCLATKALTTPSGEVIYVPIHTKATTSSEFRGVSRIGEKRWECYMYEGGKKQKVGYFRTDVEAAIALHQAYKAKASSKETNSKDEKKPFAPVSAGVKQDVVHPRFRDIWTQYSDAMEAVLKGGECAQFSTPSMIFKELQNSLTGANNTAPNFLDADGRLILSAELVVEEQNVLSSLASCVQLLEQRLDEIFHSAAQRHARKWFSELQSASNAVAKPTGAMSPGRTCVAALLSMSSAVHMYGNGRVFARASAAKAAAQAIAASREAGTAAVRAVAFASAASASTATAQKAREVKLPGASTADDDNQHVKRAAEALLVWPPRLRSLLADQRRNVRRMQDRLRKQQRQEQQQERRRRAIERKLEAFRKQEQRQADDAKLEARQGIPGARAVRELLMEGYGAAAQNLVEQVTQVIDYYKTFHCRVDFSEPWPPRADNADTKWHKLELSLARWLPKLGMPADRRALFLHHTLLYIRCSWAKR